ncbi:hypothetical protein A7982_12247 [Minicystis rosea]|nr:hypothetical protein A7982_12247 [Minicystis rosea]
MRSRSGIGAEAPPTCELSQARCDPSFQSIEAGPSGLGFGAVCGPIVIELHRPVSTGAPSGIAGRLWGLREEKTTTGANARTP